MGLGHFKKIRVKAGELIRYSVPEVYLPLHVTCGLLLLISHHIRLSDALSWQHTE